MKHLLLGLTILFPCILLGQDGIKATSLKDETKKELVALVKDLYVIERKLSFGYQFNSLKSTYEEMPDATRYDEPYLNDLFSKLGSDNLNPIHLYNISEYYAKNKKIEIAKRYCSEALKYIDIKYFNNDSASFYSFRGHIKTRLNDTTAIYDYRKAIEINPNDSISTSNYLIKLLSNREYEKVRESIKMLSDNHVENFVVPYYYLTATEVTEGFQNIANLMNTKSVTREEIAKKNYNEIVNYKLLDDFLLKYKGNLELENCRIMADFLGVILKSAFFEADSNKRVVSDFTSYEKNKFREMISTLNKLKSQNKLNQYTANKCLGYAYFITEEWDKSIDFFKKAIEIFPGEKKDGDFSPDECYDAIATLYYLRSDTANFRIALKSKVANETNKENTVDELTQLAFDYYRGGDISKAEDYCQKIREINFNSYDALRLLSHINFLKGVESLTYYYLESARKNVRNELQDFCLLMQLSIYQIYDGDFNTATENIETARKMRGAANCPLCDKLMKIIEENK